MQSIPHLPVENAYLAPESKAASEGHYTASEEPDVMTQQQTPNASQISFVDADQHEPRQPPEKIGLREKPLTAEDAPTDDTELLRGIGRGAQVWTTYVKESKAYDEDQVDGWNRSLDVTLVFAALFSAILTAFVLESVKSLKPDPSGAAAESLVEITRILQGIASGQPQVFEPANFSNRTDFHPQTRDVWVNSLWFLSLSLSVAVSLAAMLAKQWCYYFLSGRTGDPITQAENRQKRFNGIAKWRMRGILEMLPVLMHISLALFSVGLVLYLQEINNAVAATVSVVALSTIGFYAVTTLLPVVVKSCPFITPQAVYARIALRLIRECIARPGPKASSGEKAYPNNNATISSIHLQTANAPDIEAQNEVVSKSSESSEDDDDEAEPWVISSLAWLINNSQNLKSIDTAIGALAIGRVPFEATLINQDDLKEKINSHLVKHLSYCFKTHKDHGVKLHLLDDKAQKALALDYSRWMTYFAGSDAGSIGQQVSNLHRSESLGINLLTHLGLSFASISETMDLTHEDSTNIAMWLSAFIDYYEHGGIYFSEQVVSALIDGLTAASIKMPISHSTSEQAKKLVVPQLIRILWKVSHLSGSKLRISIALNLAVFALKARLYYTFNPDRKGHDAAASRLLSDYRSGKLLKYASFVSLATFSLLGLLHPQNKLGLDGPCIDTIASLLFETRFFFPTRGKETLSIPGVVNIDIFRRHMGMMLLEAMISLSAGGHPPNQARSPEISSAMRELQRLAFRSRTKYQDVLLGVDTWGEHTSSTTLRVVCRLVYDHLRGKIGLRPDVLTATADLLLREVGNLGRLDTTILDVHIDSASESKSQCKSEEDTVLQNLTAQPERIASSTLALILSESKDKQCIETAVRAVLRHSNNCGVELVERAIIWFAKRFPNLQKSHSQDGQNQLLSVSGYTRILTSMVMHCEDLDGLVNKLQDLSSKSSNNAMLISISSILASLADSKADPHVRAFGIAGLAVWRLQATHASNDHPELKILTHLNEAWGLLENSSASNLRSEELEALLDATVLLAAFKQPVPKITPENAQLILALLNRFGSESEVHARPALAVAVTFWGLSCEQDEDEWEFWKHEARKKYWRHYSRIEARREDAAALFLLGLSRILAHYSNLLLSHASITTIAREISRYMSYHSTSSTRLTIYFLPLNFDVRRHVRESVWEYLQQTQGHGPFTKSTSDTRDQLQAAITLNGGEGYIYEKPQPFTRRARETSTSDSHRGAQVSSRMVTAPAALTTTGHRYGRVPEAFWSM